jgi:phosphatidylserine decarboxylase
MRIVREGLPFVFFPILAGLLFVIFGFIVIGFILIFLGCFCAFFFRNPKRNINRNENNVLSPCDGRVLEVKQENGSSVLRVFLSVFNVHMQRAPVSGKITEVVYRPGKFLPAMDPEAHKVNEQNTFKLESPKGQFLIKQIAGIIARRVVAWKKAGDTVEQGQPIGFIKFGSQVDLQIPGNVEFLVKKNDKVVAGETVICELKI